MNDLALWELGMAARYFYSGYSSPGAGYWGLIRGFWNFPAPKGLSR